MSVKTSNNAIKVAVISGFISLLVYLRALSCGFVTLDDPLYVLENPIIRSLDWDFFSSIFNHTYANWWMPLTWISLAIDYHFWELNPFGYHLTNIVLHALNTGLVVLIADAVLKHQGSRVKGQGEFEGQGSRGKGQEGDQGKYLYPAALLLAGLLWGIHPLRVESVAWVTERKDVLNGLFALGSVLCYLRYTELKESGRATMLSRYYFLTLGLFILSLMAKSVTVVLPAVLLVLDWYPLGRLHKNNYKSVLIEKVPFFVLSAIMSVVTIFFISEASFLISNEMFPFGQRLIVSGNALFEYVRFFLYPVGIIPQHVIPDPIPLAYTVKTLISIAVIIYCIVTARDMGGRAAVLFCFVLLLVPVLAFFQNGDQSFSSRFTYLPSVAPCIAVAYAYFAVSRKVADSRLSGFVLRAFVALLLLCYVVITLRLISAWDNSEAMWNRVVEIEPSAIAFKERALVLVQIQKYDEAVEDLTMAIRNPINVWLPYIYNLYAFRGEALSLGGRYDEAVKDFTKAIVMLPHPVYYRLRGVALRKSGKIKDAENDFKMAAGETAPLEWYWSNIESQ